jgi:hypothetical protein
VVWLFGGAVGRNRRLRLAAFALANVIATGGMFCVIVILG